MMGSCDKRRGEQEEEEEQKLKLPGFRFHPTDEELVGFYLAKKVLLKKPSKIDEIISHIDIYKFDPWDLPRKYFLLTLNWFFCSKPYNCMYIKKVWKCLILLQIKKIHRYCMHVCSKINA